MLVSMGPAKAQDALRKALAMGADRPCSSATTAAAGADLVATSKALAKALEREGADLVLFGQQADDSDGAVLWAAVADRLRLPVVSQAAEVTHADGKLNGEAADGVRLRRDRGADAGRGRRLGCDQRAALPVAQGDHGREVEAAGNGVAHRPRRRDGPSSRARRSTRSAIRRARGESRKIEDDGNAAQAILEFLAEEAAPMSTLVFLEHHGGELLKGSLGVLSKAASLGDDVAALVAGAGVRGARGRRREVRRGEGLRRGRPAARGAAAAAARRRARAAGARRGRRHGPVRATRCSPPTSRPGSPPASTPGSTGTSSTSSRRTGSSSASGPRCRTPSTSTSAGRRSRASRSSAPARSTRARPAARAEVEDVPVALEDFSTSARMVDQAHEESSGPSIEDADVIVAGGRGLGGPENFTLVEELAKALGGAVGATRAVVDAGWYPYSTQVGQTGKTVCAEAVHRVRHLRRDPAQGRDAELRRDRRDQQGPERADLRVLRSRRRR